MNPQMWVGAQIRGFLTCPDDLVLGVSVGPQYPGRQDPSQILGSLPLGCGDAAAAVAAGTAAG